MSTDSMLGYGFEKSDGCTEAEIKLEWSVSKIEEASPIARLRVRCCGMNARRGPTLTSEFANTKQYRSCPRQNCIPYTSN